MTLVAKMRTYLRLAVLLCAVLSLANGFCFPKIIPPGATQCLDETDNTFHPLGSKWRNSDCMDCSCTKCCSAFGIPTGVPDDCESVFDKQACVYRVHKKGDPSWECPIGGLVGK